MDNKCKIINCIIALLSILVIVMVVILAFNSNEQEKNILTAIANEGDNTQIGITTIKFSENEILIGNAISHIENTDTININENEYYFTLSNCSGIDNIPILKYGHVTPEYITLRNICHPQNLRT